MKCSNCGAILDGGRICQECGQVVVTDEMIHQEKVEMARKYEDNIPEKYHRFHVKGNIPSVKINNAMSAYAPTLKRDTVIALYDTTITENGKEGMIITDTEIYFKAYLESAVRVKFSDIDKIEEWVFRLKVELKDGSTEEMRMECNLKSLAGLLNELMKIDKKYGIKPSRHKISRLDVMEKYGRKLSSSSFYIKGTIPNKILRNAISKYAYEASPGEVLGLIDTTIMDSGKAGILFTEDGFYQNITDDFRRKLYYKDILSVSKSGYEVEIEYWSADLKICTEKDWIVYLNQDVFVDFLNEIRKVDKD